MIKIEMIEDGVKTAKGFRNEAEIQIKGKGDVIAGQLKAIFHYLDKVAHEPFMVALEHFFKESLGEFDDYDE